MPGSEGRGPGDIPMQNAAGLPMQNVSYDHPNVHFEIPGPVVAVLEGIVEGFDDSVPPITFSVSLLFPYVLRFLSQLGPGVGLDD